MGAYRKLPFQLSQGVGAIADDAAAGFNLSDAVSEKTLISSVENTLGVSDFTVGEGPIVVYVAHSDYSDAEVAEAINAASGWDTGNKIAREQAKRLVRIIATLRLDDQGEDVVNDGRPFKTKLNWMLETGQTLQYGVFAQGGALTTGGNIEVAGHANGWAR